MAKKKKEKDTTSKETLHTLAKEVLNHFDEAKSELDIRVTHKQQGFNEYDSLYRSYIDGNKWPFNSKIFIPQPFSSILGKGARLVTGRIKGRLNATQYGNELGARIGTELLSSQYDDHNYYFDESMESTWLRMDQNARKYGAGFGLVGWKKTKRKDGMEFDGPTFQVLDNRKVYLQPGVSSISDSDYVIVERVKSLHELKSVNEMSKSKLGKSAYINLDKLERAAGYTTGNDEHQSLNATIRGLSNKSSGSGPNKKFRIFTEYRKDKFIQWTPDVAADKETPGTIIRVTDNPYDHGLIPIIRLVYIPIDDDVYGVSELEPGRSLVKATNALTSGFIEAVSTELYPVIKGHPSNVDWSTVEFKPRAAWLMNNPASDVVRLEGSFTFTRSFVEAYRLLVGQFAESMGDTTAEVSQLSSLASDKTATEIKDLALKRGARDNLNKIFFSAAITKMYSLWWSMDQQMLTDGRVIEVAGKEAIEYFINEGLSEYTLADDGYKLVADYAIEQGIDYATAYEELREAGVLEQYAQPMFPIGSGDNALPKLRLNGDGKSGFLSVNKNDLLGQYRYIVDTNTIGVTNEQQEAQAVSAFMKQIRELGQDLQAEGYRVKYKELLETIGEKLQIKNVDQFFEAIDQQDIQELQSGVPQGPQAVQAGVPTQGVRPQQLINLPQGVAGGQEAIQQELTG